MSVSIPCRYFRSGQCKNGAACRFVHSPATSSPSGAVSIAGAATSQVPCRMYLAGHCKFGRACHYAHIGADDRTQAVFAHPSSGQPSGAASPIMNSWSSRDVDSAFFSSDVMSSQRGVAADDDPDAVPVMSLLGSLHAHSPSPPSPMLMRPSGSSTPSDSLLPQSPPTNAGFQYIPSSRFVVNLDRRQHQQQQQQSKARDKPLAVEGLKGSGTKFNSFAEDGLDDDFEDTIGQMRIIDDDDGTVYVPPEVQQRARNSKPSYSSVLRDGLKDGDVAAGSTGSPALARGSPLQSISALAASVAAPATVTHAPSTSSHSQSPPQWKDQPATASPAAASASITAAATAATAAFASDDKICVFHVQGNCRYGSHCRYIHGEICDNCKLPCIHPYRPDLAEEHRRTCRDSQNIEAERLMSLDKECGICMSNIVEKKSRFGLLSGCEHAFCLDCIREWRSGTEMAISTVRACPTCRQASHFVVPSDRYIPDGERKSALIESYRLKLSTIPCKHYNMGEGKCPFGDACFYAHANKDGSRNDSEAVRRYVGDDGGVRVMNELKLSDFF